MNHLISFTGTIVFDPDNETKKHEVQSSWKKVAMVMFEGDIDKYYRWFIQKRFNLELEPPIRGAHVTFINDRLEDFNNREGSTEDKQKKWDEVKERWVGKQIEVVFNLTPFSNVYHWWLIVDHDNRAGLQAIRSELGLKKPYFGMHMTFGRISINKNEKGEELFNRNYEHSKYINHLNEFGFIDINKELRMKGEIEIKRIVPERVDLHDSSGELIAVDMNEYELNHVRIQIARKKLSGYYILWKQKQIIIEDNGKLAEWPEGLFDIQEKQLAELFKAQKENEKEGSN